MAEGKEKVSLLFICMGNICRSPTAQGIAEQQILRRGWQSIVKVDSAGTHAYHVGEAPDRRACAAALRRGIDISTQRARRVHHRDYHAFDYLLAMDERNYQALLAAAPKDKVARVQKVMRFCSRNITDDVPDPYYGGSHGFEQVLDLLENAINGLLDELSQRHTALAGCSDN